ncbi:MAG TPA: C40 family peptidase [Candidatus Competibacter sp.]|nr:NlpC/P60 family protein [Candidatus Competibacteraceae bacterium]HRE55022.1 C40 family peptidase [Candidatus Competibacter sp.]HUM95329.1 C40 family peptidase [Candidatus Competibacter sp.]
MPVPSPVRRMLPLLPLLAGLLWLGGCASPTAKTGGVASFPRGDGAGVRQRILASAERLIGAPYQLGGESPSGVDCSGLVQYAYSRAGVRVPRTAARQFQDGRPQRKVLPGDLLFFRTDGSGAVSHVGIYAGKGQMIHASSGSGRVRKVSLSQPYWQKHMVGGATYLGGTAAPLIGRWPAQTIPSS